MYSNTIALVKATKTLADCDNYAIENTWIEGAFSNC